MGFFEKYIEKQYKNGMINSIEPNDMDNVMVCCPYPHSIESVDDEWNTITKEYYEKSPNAMINLELRTFRCPICGKSVEEDQFKEQFKEEEKEEINCTFSKLEDNIKNSKFKTVLKSKLQIVAIAQVPFSTYESATFIDKKIPTANELINKTKSDADILESKSWVMGSRNSGVLRLIEGNVKEEDIDDILADICDAGKKWFNSYKLKKGKLKTVYKFSVTDIVTEMDDKYNETVIDMYTFQPLEVGRMYDVSYVLYPHPTNKQQIVMITEKINVIEDKFESNEENLKMLEIFKENEYTVEEKIEQLFQSARNHIAPYIDKNLWFILDLVYNSPLDITYQKVIRGALDIFVLGDTRTGKSETSRLLRNLYEFGSIVNLKTTTIAALVGGSDDATKTVKLGLLPRKHKELVILEEFSGAPMGFIKTLTEIRSSCMVKISRVKAELQAPCKLRMITISNPIEAVSMSSFPNGVEPILELIPAPEDVARYDAFVLVPKVTKRSNPFEGELDIRNKINKKNYETKISWIKTLTANDIIISDEVGSYIFEKSEILNDMFECSFTLFGSETDKKLARMSASLACMLCSIDDDNKVKVTKEHVDYIYNYLVNNYDNSLFKLRYYADEEKSYIKHNAEDVAALKGLYPMNTTLIDFLSTTSKASRNELQSISGMNRDEFAIVFNKLASRKFIRIYKDQVAPTIKFRNSLKEL